MRLRAPGARSEASTHGRSYAASPDGGASNHSVIE